MEHLQDILKNQNVSIARVNDREKQDFTKLDKDEVTRQLAEKQKILDIAKGLKDFTWEEKYEWVHQRKLKGNRLFKKKKFVEAIQVY